MGTSRLFMPLLRSLAGWEMDFAINMPRLTALRCLSAGFSTKPLEVYVPQSLRLAERPICLTCLH